jgi:hypothetical protein
VKKGCLAVAIAALMTMASEAHKPVTSKYTFTEHVLPIFRARCAACHVDGGVAPMSLLTYADARPWAESIRAELVAGRMPPSQAESGAATVRGAELLSPHDLDVVLTWATGGTPEGPPGVKKPDTPADSQSGRSRVAAGSESGRSGFAVESESGRSRNEWPLGTPDVVLPLPADVTLPPGVLERTEEFTIGADRLAARPIRAVVLRPGTPAIVRRAIIYVQPPAQDRPYAFEPERVGGMWIPGGSDVAVEGASFARPRDSTLHARITYRKTWKYENEAVTDRGALGVYYAATNTRPILTVPASGGTISEDVRAVAVRAEPDRMDEDVMLVATLPNGERVTLLRFVANPDWPQRFWFDRGVALARGTRLESTGRGLVLDVVK